MEFLDHHLFSLNKEEHAPSQVPSQYFLAAVLRCCFEGDRWAWAKCVKQERTFVLSPVPVSVYVWIEGEIIGLSGTFANNKQARHDFAVTRL